MKSIVNPLKYLVLVLLMQFCAFSHTSAGNAGKEYPEWFVNPGIGGYIGAVGIAGKQPGGYEAQKKLAVSIAMEDLSKQLRLIVDSELSGKSILVKKGLSQEYSKKLRSISVHNSRNLMKDTSVKDEWIDEETGELYLWLVIEKSGEARQGNSATGLVSGVEASGSCAVVNMSAEQARLLALQRARANAIESAAGVEVSSSTLVTNFELSVDIIKLYSKGYIVEEQVEWLPIGQYQRDASSAPIPEYRVRIRADVYIPAKKSGHIGLQAKLNHNFFRAGEKASVNIAVKRDSKVAVFNLMANDKVVMLFPNDYENDNMLPAGKALIFPSEGSSVVLEVQNLPGHGRDAEALFVVAMDSKYSRDFGDIFQPFKEMSFEDFFRSYSEIADYCEDLILPYEVVSAASAKTTGIVFPGVVPCLTENCY